MQNHPNNKPNEDNIQSQMSWVNMNDSMNRKVSENMQMESQMLNRNVSNVPMESQVNSSNIHMGTQMTKQPTMQGFNDTQMPNQAFGGDIGRMESLRNYGG